MNEKLKEFLDAKKEAEQKKYEEEKQKTLIWLGLSEKVYSPDNTYSEEFSSCEWDTHKYYKAVPIEITDEEYEEVKKYSKKEETTENNPIAKALTVIALIVFIGGFIAGISLGVDSESFTVSLVSWCVSLISGTMFLGFAEIIKLLEDIKKK